MECEVRKADVRWSVSPASPAWGRSQNVSEKERCSVKWTSRVLKLGNLLNPRLYRQLLSEVMLAKR